MCVIKSSWVYQYTWLIIVSKVFCIKDEDILTLRGKRPWFLSFSDSRQTTVWSGYQFLPLYIGKCAWETSFLFALRFSLESHIVCTIFLWTPWTETASFSVHVWLWWVDILRSMCLLHSSCVSQWDMALWARRLQPWSCVLLELHIRVISVFKCCWY